MANALARRDKNAQQLDPFESYAAETAPAFLAGERMKFVKGDWLFGPDDKAMPAGVELTAHMDQLYSGWVNWTNGKPDYRLRRVADSTPPILRNDLGDFDEDAWEKDEKTRKPKDPWDHADTLVLQDQEGGLYTFQTQTYGGRQALGKLARTYAHGRRDYSRLWPVVRLSCESYKHESYGNVKNPVFEVIDWRGWIGEPDHAADNVVALNPPPPDSLDDYGSDDCPF